MEEIIMMTVEALKICGYRVTSSNNEVIIAELRLKTVVKKVYVFITLGRAPDIYILCLHHAPSMDRRAVATGDEALEFIFDVFNPKFPAPRRKRRKS